MAGAVGYLRIIVFLVVLTLGTAARAADVLVDSGQRLGNEATWDVALGDLDGDGDLDAVTANFDAPAFVWLNDGAGRFSDSGQRLGTGRCESVALADFDGDEALDVLLGSWDLPPAVFWNDGTGTFVRGSFPSAPGSCQCLAVGDVDGDGRPDVFVGTDRADLLFTNAGGRTFADSRQRFGSAPTGGAAFGDMDGDGDLDLVAAGWDEVGRVWQNDGAGRLTELCSFDVVALHVHGVTLADCEGDGDLDAFFALAGRVSTGNVWLNDGTGRLAAAAIDLTSELQHELAVADFDLDGDVDIVQGIGASGSPVPSRLWLNEGGSFADSGLRMGNVFVGSLAAGDLDGDGDKDLLLACLLLPGGWDYRPAANEVWINTTRD